MIAKTKGTDATDKHVGNRVRMRREMLRMSQTTLADGLGVTFQQVQKYEKGINRIGAGRLHDMSRLLQVPVDFFFEGLTNVPEPSARLPDYVSKFVATADGLALAQAFLQIRDLKKRRSVIRLVEQLGDKART